VRRISLKISKKPETLVVDANPILSALRKGAASRIFWSEKIKTFSTTEHTIDEVVAHIPKLAARARTEAELLIFDLSQRGSSAFSGGGVRATSSIL
jgi:hypothetical protein